MVTAFIVIDIQPSCWRVDLAPTFINRGRDRHVNLVPTVNGTMLIHEGVFC